MSDADLEEVLPYAGRSPTLFLLTLIRSGRAASRNFNNGKAEHLVVVVEVRKSSGSTLALLRYRQFINVLTDNKKVQIYLFCLTSTFDNLTLHFTSRGPQLDPFPSLDSRSR